MIEFDLQKPYRCRNGWEAEIYNIVRRHGVIKYPDGEWLLCQWSEDWVRATTDIGETIGGELVNIPEEKPWPQHLDSYWYIDWKGDAETDEWMNTPNERIGLKRGLISKDRETIERLANIQLTRAKLRKILDEEKCGRGDYYLCICNNEACNTLSPDVIMNEWCLGSDVIKASAIVMHIRSRIPIADLREVFGL